MSTETRVRLMGDTATHARRDQLTVVVMSGAGRLLRRGSNLSWAPGTCPARTTAILMAGGARLAEVIGHTRFGTDAPPRVRPLDPGVGVCRLPPTPDLPASQHGR